MMEVFFSFGRCAWNCIVKALAWLFVNDCSTAESLLSLSFAINSIFTGLAFSRFNLFGWIERIARDCVSQSTDARFLKKLERLSKVNENLRKELAEYSVIVGRFQDAVTTGLTRWEWFRRSISIFSAIMAFVMLAIECKSRMGVALVLPYILLLVAYATRLALITYRVRHGFRRLDAAMGLADEKDEIHFEVSDCIQKLKESRLALTGKSSGRKTSARKKR